jgi:eukaryotic-like serine/threonine-protein kinase
MAVLPFYFSTTWLFLSLAVAGPGFTPVPALLSVAGLALNSTSAQRQVMPRINELAILTRLYGVQAGPPGAMVEVAAGKLHACDEDQGKCPQVTELPAYSINRTEVTAARFAECVKAGVCESGHYLTYADSEFCNLAAPGRETHPVNCVDYFAARSFCQWVGRRLPTLQEWQLAARGESNRKYPWGDTEPDCSFSNYHGTKGRGCGKTYTWPAGSSEGNTSASGALDLGGNVMEWTSSMARLPDDDPEGKTIPVAENKRTKRYHMGGSFADADHVQDIDFLCFDSAKTKTISLGFRCAGGQ